MLPGEVVAMPNGRLDLVPRAENCQSQKASHAIRVEHQVKALMNPCYRKSKAKNDKMAWYQ